MPPIPTSTPLTKTIELYPVDRAKVLAEIGQAYEKKYQSAYIAWLVFKDTHETAITRLAAKFKPVASVTDTPNAGEPKDKD